MSFVPGHSLGAGVAATLAVLLRNKFPGLICYAFSPPGKLAPPLSSLQLGIVECSLFEMQEILGSIRNPMAPPSVVFVRTISVNVFICVSSGGTFSRDLCRYTESFVFSVIVGDDVVPRLGLAQLDELKKQMLICLMEADRPKHEIIMGVLSAVRYFGLIFLFSRRTKRRAISVVTSNYRA